jgi:hypothetical protein
VADVVGADAADANALFDACNLPGEGLPDTAVDLTQAAPMIGPMLARTTHGIRMETTDEMTTQSRIKKEANDAAKTEPQESPDASSSAAAPAPGYVRRAVPAATPAIQFGSVSQQGTSGVQHPVEVSESDVTDPGDVAAMCSGVQDPDEVT